MSIPAKTTRKDGIVARDNAAASTRENETPRLLFVDDYADFLGMVKMVFRNDAYVLQTETQASRALEIAAKFKPHLIISDIGMPMMDGYEFICKLRETDGLAPFRAIALSGYGATENQEKALLCGFDACLIKPVDFDKLRETIDELFAGLCVETLPENHREMRPETRDFPDA